MLSSCETPASKSAERRSQHQSWKMEQMPLWMNPRPEIREGASLPMENPHKPASHCEWNQWLITAPFMVHIRDMSTLESRSPGLYKIGGRGNNYGQWVYWFGHYDSSSNFKRWWRAQMEHRACTTPSPYHLLSQTPLRFSGELLRIFWKTLMWDITASVLNPLSNTSEEYNFLSVLPLLCKQVARFQLAEAFHLLLINKNKGTYFTWLYSPVLLTL